MQPGGHRTTTQARQPVSVSPPSPVLSPAVRSRTGVGCTCSPLKTFDKLSLSPVFSTGCALFCTLKKFNCLIFIRLRTLWQKHRGWGTPSTNSNTLCDLCARRARAVLAARSEKRSVLSVFSSSGPRSTSEISTGAGCTCSPLQTVVAFSIASTLE
jgi:hypothetical protein